jgi:SAM-dependent methyltransferase
MTRGIAWIAFAALAAGSFAATTGTAPDVRFIPFSDAKPILEAASDSVPEALRGLAGEELAAAWPKWVAQRDRDIRARLEQGDEDTLTNFLLFGTSFTREPRVTLAMLDHARAKPDKAQNPEQPLPATIRKRAGDLVAAAVAPGQNERLQFAKQVLGRKGYPIEFETARPGAVDYLLRHFEEVLREYDRYAELLKAAQMHNDRREELITRSTLFKTRGVSLDTSWQPNLALEQSLAALERKELLAPASVRRVAVVGPGLDFTDKEEGYDFYPPQTIQPFAVFDSLVRLGLSTADSLEITTLDLSERVNDHVKRARAGAQAGAGYTIELTLDPAVRWQPDALAYWKDWGGRIGTAVTPIQPPAEVGHIEIRAIRVKPAIVLRILPRDLNVVLERLQFDDPRERFDLVIATNVLAYYDLFEQGLALQNIAPMLRPGGFLLSNDALVEFSGSALHSAGSSTVTYSDRKEDADYINWYQNRGPKP